jgi:hypothetical protein
LAPAREVLAAWIKEWEREAADKDRKVTDSPEARAFWKQVQQRQQELENESEPLGDEDEEAR